MFFGFKSFNKRKYKNIPSDVAQFKEDMKLVKKTLTGEETNKVDEKNKAFDGFRMVVDFETEKGEKYYNNPTAEMVGEVIDQMSSNLVNFVIVEHSKSVGGCVFVQCMWGGDGVYQVEAQVVRRDSKGILHNQYREFSENKSQVKDLFRAFLSGQAPSIRDWEHMEEFDFYED